MSDSFTETSGWPKQRKKRQGDTTKRAFDYMRTFQYDILVVANAPPPELVGSFGIVIKSIEPGRNHEGADEASHRLLANEG